MGLVSRAYHRQLPLERAALAAAAELAAVGPEDRLLDVATGTGGLLRELARNGTRPDEVVGIDASASMLAIAATGLPSAWRMTIGDARRLPFPDARFDVVTACYLLHLLQPRARAEAIDEIARVLRPGGRVVTVTVESRRAATRAALARVPTPSGLRRLDPARELAAAGLRPTHARFVSAGWPSLCVLAVRARPRQGTGVPSGRATSQSPPNSAPLPRGAPS